MIDSHKTTIILGVIGADCHAVGNKILDVYFSDHGYTVINLGVMVSQEEFIQAAIESNAKAILVSSLYGQGEIDCDGLKNRCIESGIENILLYVGGNLVIGKTPHEEIEKKYKDMGYNRVFAPDVDLDDVDILLKQDLGIA
jgi:methylaspartate mutase sigma subunit